MGEYITAYEYGLIHIPYAPVKNVLEMNTKKATT